MALLGLLLAFELLFGLSALSGSLQVASLPSHVAWKARAGTCGVCSCPRAFAPALAASRETPLPPQILSQRLTLIWSQAFFDTRTPPI